MIDIAKMKPWKMSIFSIFFNVFLNFSGRRWKEDPDSMA
jgi:hypothetical protein